jgi:hypothetical protein
MLPPHFNGQVLDAEEWETILPGYGSYYPPNFRLAIPYLLANLTYHKQWLIDSLDLNHPLFLSRVWTTGILSRALTKLQSGCMKNTVTGMTATGVPSTVFLLTRIEALERGQDRFEHSLSVLPSRVSEEIAEKNNPGQNVTTIKTLISSSITELKHELVNEIRKVHNID